MITRRAPLTTWDPTARTAEVTFATAAPVPRRDACGPYLEILDPAGLRPVTNVPVLDSHRRQSLDDHIGHADALHVAAGECRATVTFSANARKAQRVTADLTDGASFGVSCGYVVHAWREGKDASGRRTMTAADWSLHEISLVAVPADASAGLRKEQSMESEIITAEPAAPPPPPVIERASVNAEIRSIARVAGLDRSWTDGQIDGGATIDAARAAAFEAMRARSAAVATVRTATVGTDFNDPEIRARAMGEAVYARIQPAHQLSEQARPYAGMSFAELAVDCLRTRGFSTTGLSQGGRIERAMQTTSDFPLLLADTVNRVLRASYTAAPATVKDLARASTLKDFRARYRLQLSAAPNLEPVNEHGEFKSGALVESGSTAIRLSTYGKIISFTRQVLVNDDLGAFADPSRMMGQAAARFEANQLAGLVEANPVMQDGFPLFSAAHGNVATTPAPITEDSLSDARLAMRMQTGLIGELISVTPKYILVGPTRETEAEKVLTAIQARSTADVNVFSFLTLKVDPRIGSEWYVVADPAEVDGLEYAHLEGEQGPQVASQVGFEIDGVSIRVRLDYGAAFSDWRGWYRNAGA